MARPLFFQTVSQKLGARTFRNSSPNTRHEDVESYVRENFTRDKLLACLSVKNSAALILERNGQVIGYALLSPGKEPNQLVPPHSIQIKWFYILEKWIGRKLGDVLMSRCHEHAKSLGIVSGRPSATQNPNSFVTVAMSVSE
jgi:diamine N-acetyltransferase